MSYIPPRGPDGKIIVGPLITTETLQDPAAPPAPPASATPPPTSASPRRGDLPTAFAELQPGARPQPGKRAGGPPWLAWMAVALLVALAGWSLVAARQNASSSTAQTVADPSTVATIAAPTVTATPLPTLTRAVVAFDAPGGQPIGAIESGLSYALRQRQAGWRQLEVNSSGLLWVRAWEMDGQAPPTATPRPPTPAPAPAALSAPPWVPPTDAPALRCKDVVFDVQALGSACGTSDAAIWATAAQLTTAVGGQIVPTATP